MSNRISESLVSNASSRSSQLPWSPLILRLADDAASSMSSSSWFCFLCIWLSRDCAKQRDMT